LQSLDRVTGMAIGMFRIVVGFGSGVLLFRLLEGVERRGRLLPWAALLMLGAIGWLFLRSYRGGIEPLLWAPAYFSLLIFLLARGGDGFMAWRPLAHLGRISYSLYVVHGMTLTASRIAFPTDEVAKMSAPARALDILGTFAVMIILAEISHRYVEMPMRAKIVARLRARR